MVDIKQTSIHSGVIPFTPIAASSTQAAISDTNVQSAINTISTELKTLSNLTSPPEIVTVTGVILPITFPTTTLTGTPIFVPNTPASVSATYEITDGTTVIYGKWNGTQYISSSPPNIENRRFGTATPSILATDKAGDWYFRTKSGTNSLAPYQKFIYTGSGWYKTDGEDNYLVHPLDLAPSGVCPSGATSYLDFNGGWSANMTLPSASGRKNEIFTFVHDAGFNTTVLATNQFPAIPIVADATTRSITWVSNGVNWVRVDNGRQERIGRVQCGDVGSGTTATVIGDFASVVKVSPLLSNRSEFTVTFTSPMPTASYAVLIQPISVGVIGDDNELKPTMIRASLSTVNSFQFYTEESIGVVQNIDYYIFVKQI